MAPILRECVIFGGVEVINYGTIEGVGVVTTER